MLSIIIMVSVGLCVAALVGGVAVALRPTSERMAEDRLQLMTGKSKGRSGPDRPSLLSSPLEDTSTFADEILAKIGNFTHLLEQADVQMSGSKFLTICVGAAAIGAALCLVTPTPKYLAPLFAISTGILPLFWLFMRRSRRISRFNQQLPEALELLGRSLRAGHSLAAGFGLVASEMQEPISREFGRAFEEQNLGIPLEEAIEGMTLRVPNMDLRFFATAVLLQRQTGGDLAEILDKIGKLIRETIQTGGKPSRRLPVKVDCPG